MSRYRIENASTDTPELFLYGDIGEGWLSDGIRAETVVKDLAALGKKKQIAVRIDSPGGQVFEGINIYNALVRNPARINVHIDGLAASIASVIAMAGEKIAIADGSMLMIHDPSSFVIGTAADMRKEANLLEKVRENLIGIYAARTKNDADKISSMMATETWFRATEALQAGFVTEITANFQTNRIDAAALKRRNYRNVPSDLNRIETPKLNAWRAKAGYLFKLVDNLENRNG